MNSYLKHTLTFLLLVSISGFSQDFFEGQIHYKIEYETINKGIPDGFLEVQMGDSFDAFIKEDKYIMVYNAKGELGAMKTIVRLDEGFSYLIYEQSDTIYKSRLDSRKNKLLALRRVNNEKKEVLGELCEYVILDYETNEPNTFFKIVRGKHFFNPKYALNAEKYRNYTSGFWNLYVNESQAISIRNEHEYEGLYKSVSFATVIEEKKIPDELFLMDNDKIIKLVE